MKNKMLSYMVIILLLISIIGMVVLYILLKEDDNASAAPSIDKVIEQSVNLEEITTNLKNGDYLKVQFMIQLDSKDAMEEATKREFQIKDIIIKELSQITPNQMRETDGIDKLEEEIVGKVNKLMQEGKVVEIYTTSFLLQ